MTARQISAAMALAGMNQDELASAAGIARPSLNRIVNEEAVARDETLGKLRQALEARNVEFLSNEGVRLKSSDVEIYEGAERFETFTNFVYEQIRTYGGHICLSVTDERLFSKYRTNTIEHYRRMQELFDRGVIKSFRILANKSNFSTEYTYNTYRWQPEGTMAPTAFYTFSDYLALISFEHTNPPYVLLVRSAPLAETYHRAFDVAWNAGKEPPKTAEERK
ncbi:helix-turn-helix transcriptional regulator [Bradyrhizobium diazoefficiens]|nr:helix-turn-helix transcriptional regulator [Bradyrhizobium diazoefficiens]MBR0981262.1 helix-turn-helix transcriptional regulator [Bradyrhizobium diazoefficiens]MBR1060938.1 helix-turn-helix transcriptional regulator [Bradyrhizobium diazoefficiens]MBR1112342.1 helix-turn-helix transcriptional regulator [Bradyrhizobium diazoefficiens]MBR1118905.1 helix-turn-helix transcriptional regulator [Bradyrhizobium diazoefficiens]